MRKKQVGQKELLPMLKEGRSVTEIANSLGVTKSSVYYNMQLNRLEMYNACPSIWTEEECKRGIPTDSLREIISSINDKKKKKLVSGFAASRRKLDVLARQLGLTFEEACAYLCFLNCLCPIPKTRTARNEKIAMWLNAEKMDVKEFSDKCGIPLSSIKELIYTRYPVRALSIQTIATLMGVTGLSYEEITAHEKECAEELKKVVG